MPIINGRRVDKDFMSGDEILTIAAPGQGRRSVRRSGMDAETIQRGKRYDVRDKKGKPVRIENIPDRTKGIGRRHCG